MPTHTTPTHSAAAPRTTLTLDSQHAADLADLLRCLREWIDAEHDQLEPLLATHDYDITGLRIALDRHTALLTSSPEQPPF